MKTNTSIIHRTILPAAVLLAVLACFLLVSAAAAPAFAEDGENAVPMQPQNGIPLVIIRIDESQEAIEAAAQEYKKTYGTIQEMEDSDDHSVRCTGTAEIIVPAGYEGEYGSVQVPAGKVPLKYIRGRGNSTWTAVSKRPYKIEYTEKQDLFGMGADKEWALLANYYDDTMLRNRITSWLGAQMGMNEGPNYTPQMIPVDVVMIGTSSGARYLGSYCLSELVSTGGTRVDLKLDGVQGKGQLLSKYNASQDEGDPYFETSGGLGIKCNDPEEVVGATQEFVNALEALIMAPGDIDEARHREIADKMDLQSAANYWWVQEFSYNTDAFFTSSTYMVKKGASAEDAKLFWGPLWDFDLAYSIGIDSEDSNGSAFGLNTTQMDWFDQLRENDPRFVALLKERWQDPNNGLNALLIEVTRQGGILDEYRDELRASWEADRGDEGVWGKEFAMMDKSDFDRAVEALRNWIELRRAWIDKNIEMVGRVHFNAAFMADGEVVDTVKVRGGSAAIFAPDAPDKKGYIFKEWVESGSGESNITFKVNEDVTFNAVYIKESEVVKPKGVYFSQTEDWTASDDEYYFTLLMKILPEDAATGQIKWTSSDPDVASFRGEALQIHSPGDTVITATLFNGVSASYVLHVYDPAKVTPGRPAGIAAVPKTLTLRQGQTEQIKYTVLPEGNMFARLYAEYILDDPEILTIDDIMGIVTGAVPGTATVKINLYYEGDYVASDTCRVTVISDQEAGPAEPPSAKPAAPGKPAKPASAKPAKKIKKASAPAALRISTKAKKKKKMIVSWNRAAGAAGYQVSYRRAGASEWKTVYVRGLKAKLKGMKEGRLYQFKAAAVDAKKKPLSASAVTYRYYRHVRGVKVKARKGAVRVKWKKAKGASGYQILISESKDLKNVRIITRKGSKKKTYTVTGLEKGKRYYIAVRPYKNKGGKRYIGIRCSIRKARVK